MEEFLAALATIVDIAVEAFKAVIDLFSAL